VTACADLSQRKHCTSCGVEKSLEEFYSKGSRLDSQCKECKKERSRADYRFKLGPRDKERLALLADTLLDFHLERQQQVIADIDALIARASARSQT
jgi:hypothetical protein